MLGEAFDDVLRRAQAGDAQAFAVLWRETNPMLLRYLRVTAGDQAEDVASSTWLKAIEALGGFDGNEPGFRRWVVTIARNQHLDQVRSRARRPEDVTDDIVALADVTGAWSPDAAHHVERRMSTEAAIALIARLPQDQAELLMLRIVVGLDVAEVAEVTGRTPGSVRVAVHRALRRLRDHLDAGISV